MPPVLAEVVQFHLNAINMLRWQDFLQICISHLLMLSYMFFAHKHMEESYTDLQIRERSLTNIHHNSKGKRKGNRSGEAKNSRRERERVHCKFLIAKLGNLQKHPVWRCKTSIWNTIFFLHYLSPFFFLLLQYLVYFLVSMINFYSIQIYHLSYTLSAKDGHLFV